MSFAAIKLCPLYKSVLSVLCRRQRNIYRLTRLCYLQKHNFCNISFQGDLSIDKNLLNKYVEEIVQNSKPDGRGDLNILLDKRDQLLKNISSLNSLNAGEEKDDELNKLLEEESQQYSLEIEKLNLAILHSSYLKLHGAHLNDNSTVLEIAAGVGGQEAMLFAGELFNMYNAYALSQGWEIELVEVSLSDLGGIKNLVASVRGPGVYKALRCEGGVHRVQRVPLTDRNARLHTSTATVVVMPEPSEIDIAVHEKDIKIEVKRPSGPGGQNAQKSNSSVRITHTPTGIVSASQEHRTQSKNVQVAMKLLRARLYAMNFGKQEADVDAVRRQQEGSRMRSEKIRTYNVLQDRVTDHRWGTSLHNLTELWNGGPTFETLMKICNENYEEQLFKDYLSKLKATDISKKGQDKKMYS